MIEIRLATSQDASGIAEIYAPIVKSTPTSFEIEPPDAREFARRIQETLPKYPWLVCEQRGRVTGYAYAGRHSARAAYEWSVNTSVYIHHDFHRRGIGRGLYESLFLILTAQGYFNAYAGITLPNAGSVGLHEALGFQPVGIYRDVGHKFGAWHDVGWWQRPLRPRVEAPSPPRSVDMLQAEPQWSRMLAVGLASIHLPG
jgi:phosphinothricin acetyltransferase